ncbi:uncharacterized protein BDR25DRAFT_305026 [Lindgomyces ingoldianus]|uniref:Uncharacterized protein n=1 Tax=Lindgomyces ingoldianus TaxID=673940 RepID=A0ACB6QN56_9PLEO|nr:uncharacterized protein BDR25DRAFT_305026 [Lindgomyces ingoldianus]KAF2468302.1 hypothetical protein BDR25DRAFT_305026 [Lindgomyces ingoldianus]
MTGFSTPTHLIRRLCMPQQNAAIIPGQFPKPLPILLDRLGDAREYHSNAASLILGDLWPLAHQPVWGLVRHHAMKSISPRAKEASMQ